MPSRILSELLRDIPAEGPTGLETAVSGIAYRSDQVRPGDVFFCVRGFVADGHDYARDAVARGAVAVVCEHPIEGLDVPQAVVPDARAALASASARFFGMPSQRLRVLGVTGTNGKTTTTYLIDSIMRAAGSKTGLIGTVETLIGGRAVEQARTTPESRDLQELLARMADEGVDTVAMEVSSHALDLHRVDGVRFAVAAFTNLTQDHLDYHGTLEEYFAVKSRLFTGHDVGRRVIAIDDEAGRALAAEAGAWRTVGLDPDADVRAERVVLAADHSTFRLVCAEGAADVRLPLSGAYNVSNALVAAACALALDVPLGVVVHGLETAPQVPGRLERVDAGQPFPVLVDYAHTPDALAKALAAVREVTPGRVIVVFGCGGDRDPGKRPLMGRIAGEKADVVVLTTDNPRSEDPADIIAQIETGAAGTAAEMHVVPDRGEAIALAVSIARAGDSVLLAGKGHEDYQIFSDRTTHWDDREAAAAALAVTGRVPGC